MHIASLVPRVSCVGGVPLPARSLASSSPPPPRHRLPRRTCCASSSTLPCPLVSCRPPQPLLRRVRVVPCVGVAQQPRSAGGTARDWGELRCRSEAPGWVALSIQGWMHKRVPGPACGGASPSGAAPIRSRWSTEHWRVGRPCSHFDPRLSCISSSLLPPLPPPCSPTKIRCPPVAPALLPPAHLNLPTLRTARQADV